MKNELVRYTPIFDEEGKVSGCLIFESVLFAVPSGLHVSSSKAPFEKYIVSGVFDREDEKSFHDYIKALKREAGKLYTTNDVGIIVPEEKIPEIDEWHRDMLRLEGFSFGAATFYTNDMKIRLKRCWINIMGR